MANFAGICSTDASLRRRFADAARRRMACPAGWLEGEAEEGCVSLVWAAPRGFAAGISKEGGSGRFEFGKPDRGSERTAFWVRLEASREGARLRSDPLGFCPVFFSETDEAFSFASAFHLASAAEGLTREIDPESLATLLLLGAIPGSGTLLRGLRRLPPFAELRWTAGGGLALREAGKPEISDRFFGATFSENLERVDEALSSAVDAAVGSAQEVTFLLSGGLDSRLLAGYLARRKGLRVRAVTMGRPDDVEVRCARRVSELFGWEHALVSEETLSIEALAELRIDHEGMAGGFSLTPLPAIGRALEAETVLCGAYGDGLLGCADLYPSPKSRGPQYQAEYFKDAFRSYFDPFALSRLIRNRGFSEAVSRAHESLRGLYDGLSGSPFQKAWQFDALYVDRLRVAFPRYLSFAGRPALPFADLGLFEVVAGIPPEHLERRRMETELLARRFPALAVLPADRNRRHPAPPIGIRTALLSGAIGLGQKGALLGAHARGFAEAFAKRFRPTREDEEPRFYYRTLDVNRPAWLRLRRLAEEGRPALERWADPAALRRVWPGPDGRLDAADAIYHGQRARLLIGLALWFRRMSGEAV